MVLASEENNKIWMQRRGLYTPFSSMDEHPTGGFLLLDDGAELEIPPERFSRGFVVRVTSELLDPLTDHGLAMQKE